VVLSRPSACRRSLPSAAARGEHGALYHTNAHSRHLASPWSRIRAQVHAIGEARSGDRFARAFGLAARRPGGSWRCGGARLGQSSEVIR
jgi:hypothetical protein